LSVIYLEKDEGWVSAMKASLELGDCDFYLIIFIGLCNGQLKEFLHTIDQIFK